MALADVFKQTTFDPAEYEMQLNYNRNLQQQRAIAAQKAEQERINFLQQQRGREEIEGAIRGDWYTDKAIQAAEQSYQQPLTAAPPMQPMSMPLGAGGPPPANIMPQAPPMSMAPQGAQAPPMGLETPQAPPMGQPPQRPTAPRPPGGFQTLEGYTWGQQQEDRRQKLNDAKAAKILEVFAKPGVQENPDLAKKVGSWLAQVPGYEEMAAAIQDAEFGKPGQKIVFGMQLKNLPPEERAAIGDMSPEEMANIGPTDKITLKQVGGKWMMTDYKPGLPAELEAEKIAIRKRANELRAEELRQKNDPTLRSAVRGAEEYGKYTGKAAAEAVKELPRLEARVKKLDGMAKLVDENPKAFGKLQGLKATIAAWTDPDSFEKTWSDTKARRQLEVEIANLMDNDLKKMFGPQISNTDIQMIYNMSGADLASPTALKQAISNAKASAQRDYEAAREYAVNYKVMVKDQGSNPSPPARQATPNRVSGQTPKALLPPTPGAKINKAIVREFFKIYKDPQDVRAAITDAGWSY